MSAQPQRFVYLLATVAAPSRHYIGVTSDVEGRLHAHNAGRCPSTSGHRPWRVICVIEFADEAPAVRFEKYLKTGSGHAFARRHLMRRDSKRAAAAL